MTERCAGCGIESESHPIVGVGKPTDELKPYEMAGTTSPRGFVAYGVCASCHEDPAHRVRVLKMAFFFRPQLAQALAAAGSTDIRQQ